MQNTRQTHSDLVEERKAFVKGMNVLDEASLKRIDRRISALADLLNNRPIRKPKALRKREANLAMA